jgi:hypothetical protein
MACGMQVASSTAQCSPSQSLVRSAIREITVGEMSLACCHLYLWGKRGSRRGEHSHAGCALWEMSLACCHVYPHAQSRSGSGHRGAR